MTAQSIVTLWHKTENGYEKKTYNAHAVLKVSIEKSGIKEKGFHSGTRCEVRIPTKKSIDVALNDYIRVGYAEGEPNLKSDYKIAEIADNRRGGEPHIRLSGRR